MLARINRLTKKADFEKVKAEGRFVTSKLFSMSTLDRKDGRPSRFGFVVSKKVSNKAYVRNKLKRIMREVVKKYMVEMKSGMDVVVIAKSGGIQGIRGTMEAELKNILDI